MLYKDVYFDDYFLPESYWSNSYFLNKETGEIIYHFGDRIEYKLINVDKKIDPKEAKGSIIADLVFEEEACYITNIRRQKPFYMNPVVHKEYYPNVVTKSKYYKRTTNVFTGEVIDIKWEDWCYSHLLSKEESEFPYKKEAERLLTTHQYRLFLQPREILRWEIKNGALFYYMKKVDALHQSDGWAIAPKQKLVLLTCERHDHLGGVRLGDIRTEEDIDLTAKSTPMSLKAFAVSKGAEWKPNEYREEAYIDAVLGPRGKSKWIKKTDEELYPEFINEYKKSYLPNFVAKDERHTRKKVTIKRPYKVVNEEYGIDVLISQVYTQQVYFDNATMNYTYTAPTFVKEEVEKFEFDVEKINAQFVKEFKAQLIK